MPALSVALALMGGTPALAQTDPAETPVVIARSYALPSPPAP